VSAEQLKPTARIESASIQPPHAEVLRPKGSFIYRLAGRDPPEERQPFTPQKPHPLL